MDAWLNMEVTLPPDFGLTEFQAEELSSLLETSHAQTYADLMLDGNRFKIAMNLINIRSTDLIWIYVFSSEAARAASTAASSSKARRAGGPMSGLEADVFGDEDSELAGCVRCVAEPAQLSHCHEIWERDWGAQAMSEGGAGRCSLLYEPAPGVGGKRG